MGHISYNEQRTEIRETPEGWLPISSAIGQLVNMWSDRDDLVAYVGEKTTHGTPASYNPVLEEVEVSIPLAFGNGVSPDLVGDLLDSKNRYNFPKTVGVLYHEAFHARFSRWSAAKAHQDLSKDEANAIMLLEEGRVENFGVRAIPKSRSFLRACATEIIMAESEEKLREETNTNTCGFYVALCHGRLVNGVLKEKDVKRVKAIVEDYFGEKVMAQLISILERFQAVDDHWSPDPKLYDLAREWARVLQDVAEEKGDMTPQQAQKLQDELQEAMLEMAEDIAIDNQNELNSEEQDEENQERLNEKQRSAQERQKAKKTAKDVFGKGTAEIHQNTNSRLEESRPPTSPERGSAVRVAKQLERAKYRDRDVVETSEVLPPGRLRPRTLIQAQALKERGVMAQVEPWRKKRRKQTENPTLQVGVMVDISGSMRSAMEPMGVTAWVLSEAVRRVQGKTAMVYYGNTAFPTLKPGQHLDQVNIYTASDGTESFDQAFRALDGALDLTTGSGARLLVIVSDGHYTSNEVENAKQRLQQCERTGVAVLWLNFDSTDYSVRRYMNASPATEFLLGELDPVKASDLIGQSAVKVLTRAGR